jgi:hypothetical protein
MTYQAVAQQFGDCIVRGDLSAAWGLLAQQTQATISPEAIASAVATMIADAPGPIQQAQVVEDGIVEDWPAKRPGDLAVVYVALMGQSFSEAVTLTLAQYGEATLIRQLEWGRP